MSKKSPQLRFEGFTDDWEERKLSDGTNKIGDGLHGTPKYSEDGEVYFVNGNNLVNGQIVIMPETKRVTSNEQSKDDKALNESTILMSINGTIGNLAWYRGENLMLGKSAAYIEVSDFDKKFIYAYLQTRPVKDYYLNSLTGTTIKNLGLKAIRNTNICTPTIDEQAKIGSFFKKLDDTIALHQRKLDLLKEQKKGYLQKMFPKNGAKVPELRFAGFADDWEQRKLSDIVVRLNKSSNNNQLPKVEFEDIIAGEGRLNKDISRKFDDRKGTLFEPDNILYGKLRPYLKNWLFSDFKGIALGDFWVFKSINSEPKFVYSLIQSDNYQRVANDTSGTKMPRSDWKKVSSSNFSIPTSLEEQQKIGSFFKQLDDTISLHQRKLDLLKEQKKGFLQKMFV